MLNKQIADVSLIERESDSLYARLCEMMDRVHWHLPQESEEVQAKYVSAALSELMSVVQQAVRLDGCACPPSSIERIGSYCSSVAKSIEDARERSCSKLTALENESETSRR